MSERELSKPRAGVAKYAIYPTGYDQSPFADTFSSFVIYVEQFPDTGRWRVHDGFRYGLLLSRSGRWIRDTPLNRQWTRFETAEEAIDLALKHTDDRPGYRSLPDAIRSHAARDQEDA